TQPAKKVVFLGTFTAGGLDVEITNGRLKIISEGKHRKFLKNVKQITFSGKYAREHNQLVYYVTERAVFKLSQEGVELIEYAPGIDIERDILSNMDFMPIISPNLKEMPKELFHHSVMNISNAFNGQKSAVMS
ncbi:MAG TPA: acyl CoA:acetate/3-ketoacid CoA transferase, partial [Ureibacillus sp.]|nr:acyl CoA:acetate/3-ketoacid CoA transferase [Ureibacillus sp.]